MAAEPTLQEIEALLRIGKAKGEYIETPDGRWDITCVGARRHLTVEEHRQMHRLKGTACEDHLV